MRSRLDISPVELIEAKDSTKNQVWHPPFGTELIDQVDLSERLEHSVLEFTTVESFL